MQKYYFFRHDVQFLQYLFYTMLDITDNEVLRVDDLSVFFCREAEEREVVSHISYSLSRGETLGIVGESGSGKSVSTLALMQLLPPAPLCRVEGKALFRPVDGIAADLLSLPESAMRSHRGRHISMIFQEPMTSLNPVQRCGRQVAEMLQMHTAEGFPSSAREQRERVLELFNEVRLPRPEKIFDSYPHEISGGQKQRVMIAMALLCRPDILIADEPTTALDVTVQRAILDLLRDLQAKHRIGIIFISHDLAVIGQIADRVAVMYHGSLVEQGATAQLLHHPRHPYTQGLLACRPPAEGHPRHLPTVDDFMNAAGGNPFANIESATDKASEESLPPGARKSSVKDTTPLLQVRDLEVTYALKKTLFGKVTQELKAVDKVSFDIYEGETLGLVGESGCGKTTLGRTLLQLLNNSGGSSVYRGLRLDQLNARQMKKLRPKLQIIFQDPYSSLNPRITIGEAIMEPLICHRRYGNHTERQSAVLQLMQQVGLKEEWYNRYPHEFSGGQRQRVCIARALILQPELVVCDESVSALDVSVQAQVLNLLNDLKRNFHYTYLFISHDLGVVRFISDRIMVMHQGRIVETGTADQLYRHPQNPYTQQLIDAIPRI